MRKRLLRILVKHVHRTSIQLEPNPKFLENIKYSKFGTTHVSIIKIQQVFETAGDLSLKTSDYLSISDTVCAS
jgi:hypothetical protein